MSVKHATLLGVTLCVALAQPGLAQDAQTIIDAQAAPTVDAQKEAPPPQGRIIEEILVTANKTEQSVQEIPGSVQALTGDFMAKANLTDFSEVAKYMPNTMVVDDGIEPTIAVRGVKTVSAVGGGDNSVGLVIDDLALSRQTFFHNGFFDLERIEVLRGPQGTLFGKSTTAGVINIVTNAPTDEFSGSVILRQGLDDQQVQGAIGGPVMEGLALRLSIMADRPGSLRTNTFDDSDVGYIDRTALRAKLRWEPTDAITVDLFFNYADVKHRSVNEQFLRLDEHDRTFLAQFDPQIEGDAFDGNISFDAKEQTWIDGALLYGGRLDADFGTPLMFTNLTGTLVLGAADMQVYAFGDLDRSPADVFRVPQALEDIGMEQIEARVNGMTEGFFGLGGGTLEFISGVFYQEERVKYDYRITGGDDTVAYLVEGPGPEVLGLGPPLSPVPCPLCVLPDLGGVASLAGDGIKIEPSMVTKALGVFTQLTYRPWDAFAITAGIRYDRTNRDAHMPVEQLHPSGMGELSIIAPLLGAEGDVTFTPIMREREISSKLSLQYELFDGDVVTYATWAKGYKGGAFNFFALAEAHPLQADPEFAELFEVGAKTVLLSRTLVANLSLYRSEFTDLHVYVATENGVLPFIALDNAAAARSQGVEFDFMYLPGFAPWLSLSGAMAYSDAYYIDYKNGPDGSDLSGETLVNAPTWSVVFTPEVGFAVPWANNFGTISLGVDAIYTSSFWTNPVLEPEDEIDGVLLLNARLTFTAPSENWTIALTGTNLTDEEYYAARGDYGDSLWPQSSMGRPANPLHASLDFTYHW